MTQQEVIQVLESASAKEIQDYLDAAFSRYRALYPDWDITYMAIPQNDLQDRSRTIQYIMEMLGRDGNEEFSSE